VRNSFSAQSVMFSRRLEPSSSEAWKTSVDHQPVADIIVLERGGTMPTYERGDYIKVEFPDEATGIGEWMWVRVHRCDDENRIVFGALDNEPLHDYEGRIELGSELAVSYSQIREHRKPTEFTKQ